MNTLTVLGSGTSTGIPILGCKCDVCQSTNPANKRLRASVFLQTDKQKNILVDATPDLRSQLLRADFHHVDAAIITHDHADHTHGLDDLRPFSFFQKKAIPIHCSHATADSLRKKFDYIFERDRLYHSGRPVLGGGIPQLDLVVYQAHQATIAEEEFKFFDLPHGYVTTSGFMHRSLAYLVDCHSVPSETLEVLAAQNLQWLVLDCVRPEPHDTHMGLAQTLEVLSRIRPQKAGLIHMGHEWDHEVLAATLKQKGFPWAVPLKDGDQLRYS